MKFFKNKVQDIEFKKVVLDYSLFIQYPFLLIFPSTYYWQAPEIVDTHFICFTCVDGTNLLELSLSICLRKKSAYFGWLYFYEMI